MWRRSRPRKRFCRSWASRGNEGGGWARERPFVVGNHSVGSPSRPRARRRTCRACRVCWSVGGPDSVVGWIGAQRRYRDGAERDLSSGYGFPGVGEQCSANRRTWGGSGSFGVGVGGALGGVCAVAPSAAGHCSTHRPWRHGWIGAQRVDRAGTERDLGSRYGLPGVGEQCSANRRIWDKEGPVPDPRKRFASCWGTGTLSGPLTHAVTCCPA